MDKKNLMPQAAQPIHRTTLGQLPPELAELSEEALSLGTDSEGQWSSVSVLPQYKCKSCKGCRLCSYDGDDAE